MSNMTYQALKEEMARLMERMEKSEQETKRVLANQSEWEEESIKDIKENLSVLERRIDKLDRALDILNE